MNEKNFNICSLLSQNQVYIGTSIGEIETFNLFDNSFKKENIVIDESKNQWNEENKGIIKMVENYEGIYVLNSEGKLYKLRVS